MQVNETIRAGLIYIEQNLKSSITVEELAEMAGYSPWHYRRIFSQETGTTVAAYIGKHRLDRALGEMIGGRRVIDVALDYGFETYAGFYKAFVKQYGNSPKNYFRKEIVTMFTEKEIQNILSNWDIPKDLPILDMYIMDGAKVSGNIWSIGEEYILKTAKRESLLNNLKVAKAMAAQNFAAATPIPTKSGTEYLDGDNITVLTRGIKGSPLPKSDRFGDNRKAYGRKYGESIARLHNALSKIEPNIEPKELNQYTQVMEWAMPETKKLNLQYNMGLPNSFFDDYVENFGKLFEQMPKQLIHRDPNPSNILFDNGEITGFIDFDFSHRNIRLFDPCYCATGILCEWHEVENIYEKWPEILEGILRGYDRVNPLTAEEKQAVFYVVCSIQMVCAAWFETQTGTGFVELARKNREMLSYIVEHKAQIAKIF